MTNHLISKRIGINTRALVALRIAKYCAWACKSAAVIATASCLGFFAASPAFAQESAEQSSSLLVGSAGLSKTQPSAAAPEKLANFLGGPVSNDARQVADWVLKTGDNGGLPFVLVDKKATKVFVFDGRGTVLGATDALLGLARGDDSAPGIGDRKLSKILPQERTTPAGRFVAVLGHDLGKQDVLWVDYPTALALHRVLPANSKEHRLQRLAAASSLDHRITFGCINVPSRFYDAVVDPVFAGTSGVVYILPEVKPIEAVFKGYVAEVAVPTAID
jgi:hypothetical protein